METKAQIRKKYKEIRQNFLEEKTAEYSGRICMHLQNSRYYKEAKVIAFYYPLGKEVSLNDLVRQAWLDGKCTVFPKVVGEDMEFYAVSDFSQLKEGYFHVMEPVGQESVELKDALILTPGVVFDRQGGRFGYGKGFYDRYFAAHPFCKRIGVAYEAQVTEKLPMEQHDIGMQNVVTENGFVWQEDEICS